MNLCPLPIRTLARPLGLLMVGYLAPDATAQTGAPGPQLQPLPHPELPQPPPAPAEIATWVWGVAALLTVFMVALILWFLLRPRPAKPQSLAQPRQIALRALRQLHSQVATLPPPEIGHRVSTLLRQYLQDRYRIPAPFRTTPELFSNQRLASPPPTGTNSIFEIVPAEAARLGGPKSPVAHFAPLAELWDRLAFAPLPATSAEASRLIETAIQRIEEDPA